MSDMTSVPAELTAWLSLSVEKQAYVMDKAKYSKNMAVFLRRCLAIVKAEGL